MKFVLICLICVISVLFLITTFVLFYFFRQKRKANNLLVEQKNMILERNEELLFQKEEILAQTEQLELTTKELEKLSIVASETDNAIVIFDAKGRPEWVNNGFIKINGFDLDEFISIKGDNLFKMDSLEDGADLAEKVITQKKTVTYSCQITTKSGEKLWIQTTLSPVLDKDGNLYKIIAIDSDITKLKEAEEEIKQQKEEIESQRDEIEFQRSKLSKSNAELSSKNTQIIDSITYAQLIQEALLPDVISIQKYFSEIFIYYKPRDLVSGDFYWFHVEDNLVFFAIADCTGHGVPGAFMSMIGTTLLNEIVKHKKIYTPSLVLSELNQEVIMALKQREKDTKSQGDGMDITFLVFDKDKNKLILALANHTSIIIQNNISKQVKGDIYSIGGMFGCLQGVCFSDQEFEVSDDTIIYLFSDGIKDQFSHSNEKYGEERLLNQLVSNKDINLAEQNNLLSNVFEKWKDDAHQTDDVLVVGIRF